MKVIQVNSVCGVGSTGRIAVQIGRLVTENGGQSVIAYGRGHCAEPSTYRFGTNIGLFWHVLQTRLFDRHGLGSHQATQQLISLIRETAPDIIHLHNLHGYYVEYKQLFDFLKIYGRPVVWTLHDCWTFTGHCAYFEAANCEKWKEGCYECPQKKQYPKSWLCDRSLKNFGAKRKAFCGVPNLTIVTPSEWLADTVKKSFLSGYPVRVIHNGVDTNVFQPAQSDFRVCHGIGDRFMMLGVSNVWDDRKGLNDFVAMAQQLESDETIVLVGLGKKQIHSLPQNIVGIERTENAAALAGAYSAADVFLNPTKEDTFPTTNIEAMACGTPVVSYDSGGSGESVRKGCGTVLSEKTPEAMLAATRELKARWQQNGAAQCRERAQALFDMNEKFMEYISFYEELLPH